jgi:hypothetical protein
MDKSPTKQPRPPGRGLLGSPNSPLTCQKDPATPGCSRPGLLVRAQGVAPREVSQLALPGNVRRIIIPSQQRRRPAECHPPTVAHTHAHHTHKRPRTCHWQFLVVTVSERKIQRTSLVPQWDMRPLLASREGSESAGRGKLPGAGPTGGLHRPQSPIVPLMHGEGDLVHRQMSHVA